jgi:hypothetical protein
MRKGEQFWCWWLHRYLIFVAVESNGTYHFEDFGDEQIYLNQVQVEKLERR